MLVIVSVSFPYWVTGVRDNRYNNIFDSLIERVKQQSSAKMKMFRILQCLQYHLDCLKEERPGAEGGHV